MDIKEAINKIDEGNCILFVGSGFSYGAEGNSGKLTTASDLVKELYRTAIGEDEPNGNLEDAAELFIEKRGEFALIDFLKAKFNVFQISSSQEYTGSLPWLRIYTTNYDNVLNIAYQKNRRRLEHVYLSRRIRDYADKKNLCIHLNGTIENLTPDTLNNEFKLTTSSYLTENFVDSEWINLFISDLHTADVIFFVGYSMNYDLDIQRIVKNSLSISELKEKCFFIVRENEPKYNIRKLEKFGTPIAIGLDRFVEKLKVREKCCKATIERKIYCFKKPNRGNVVQKILAQDAFSLYVKGDANETHIRSSLFQPDQFVYVVRRTILDVVVEKVKNGVKQIMVESYAGNGKTCLMKSLACILSENGYDVYVYNRFYETLKSEIEHICTNSNGKTVIIVDNFSHSREMLEELSLFRSNQTIIVADRTLACDVSYEWLYKKFGDFESFDIDSLDDKELNQIVGIFNKYGFFGKRASLRDDQKYEYLRTKCKSTMRDILLDLLNSETIRNRFAEIVNSIKDKKSYYDALILMLVSPIFGFSLDFNQLAFIFDKYTFVNPSFYKNTAICEFIEKSGTDIHVKSSILAECILSEVLDPSIIVDVLIMVFKKLDKYRDNEEYRGILRSMLSYQNIKRVLNTKHPDFSDNVTRFFDEVGTTNFCACNQHYWLQYAISRLFVHDFERSFQYFENAYSFAKKKQEFNNGVNYTYQIDNHFARYLLENEIENGTVSTCMLAFKKAHKLLMNPQNKEIVRFYTYRVARNYFKFYRTYYNSIKNEDKKLFLQACEEMYNRTLWYIGSNNPLFARKGEAIATRDEMICIFQETGYERELLKR